MTKARPSAHMTVPEVAEALGMTRDGVYKLIRRGKLKAVRLSARKMYVSRLALDAYRRRLAGKGPEITRPTGSLPLDELRADFEQETGRSPEAWLEEWRAGTIEDS